MEKTATTASTITPASSPGLFNYRKEKIMENATPLSSPYLHPLSLHKVKETHDARVERDLNTGRKCINQYEIVEEIGRGVHGKVKLARNIETKEEVAIKIIQRFSKKRRLGRVVASPEQKIKREIAILKKVRHPNVVGLLEVIDDPELKKIYMVLEHVELGEIVWRKKGDRSICIYERQRIEREMRGEFDNGEAEMDYKMNERRRLRRIEAARAKASNVAPNYWSLEHGADEDDDMAPLSRQNTHGSNSHSLLSQSYASTTGLRSIQGISNPSSGAPSRAPSRTQSRAQTPQPVEAFEIGPPEDDDEDDCSETPGYVSSLPSHHGSAAALEGTMYGSYVDDTPYRGRTPSMPDSFISHMTSHDDLTTFQHDPYAEDYAYVPCFTIEQARTTFRDTVLGLEYLHYEGIVHRDIKPANLLWNKDHRVKISDFGVSYFGRPIRDGEPEENISEADAQDFDDDLELAKTVGTPAFFAPELCYTDGVQHKVNEQIDVWSLGVTLYCLIFARIPFLAEDEFKLFRTIATVPVYIPKRRLRAVDPSNADSSNPPKRQTLVQEPYRDDSTLVYEDIDDELHDLLRRMLIKDPTERIKLREVKRHPWVLRGISNVIGWLDDTDPSRRTEGRRIQVDERELEHAVVPITLLERARSNVKKVLGKVIGTISEGRGSRGRALSTATSSAGDSYNTTPSTPTRDTRRASLKGDESFFASAHAIQTGVEHLPHHPLSQSVISSPIAPKEDPLSYEQKPYSASAGTTPQRQQSYTSSDTIEPPRPALQERSISNAASVQTVIHRGHSYSRSLTDPPSPGTMPDGETQLYDHSPERKRYSSSGTWRRHSQRVRHAKSGEFSIDMPEMFESDRSSDRPLFTSDNKHGEASIGISNAVAPGAFDTMEPRAFERAKALSHRSSDLSSTPAISPISLTSPGFFESSTFGRHQYFAKPFFLQSSSTPNVPLVKNVHDHTAWIERPSSAFEGAPESRTPSARLYGESTQEMTGIPYTHSIRRQRFEDEETHPKIDFFATVKEESEPTRPNSSGSTGPTAPGVASSTEKPEEQAKRAQSMSSVASSAVASPPEVASPISSQDPAFRSDPSLPALVSGASSMSGDPEDEFLKQPGVVQGVESIFDISEGADVQTPPALIAIGKDALVSAEVAKPNSLRGIPIVGSDDESGYNGDADLSALVADDDDDDSDSDEGLTMGMGRKNTKSILPPTGTLSAGGATPVARPPKLTRRGTNASVASTDTAKKVLMSE